MRHFKSFTLALALFSLTTLARAEDTPRIAWNTYFTDTNYLYLTPDESTLVIISHEGGVSSLKAHIIDTKTKREILAYNLDMKPAVGRLLNQFAAFSADGKFIVHAQRDDAVVTEILTGKTIAQLKGHTAYVRKAIFSPDGKLVATAAADATVRIWDAATGKELLQLENPGVINAFAFSPDSKFLLAGEGNAANRGQEIENAIRLWDVTSGAKIKNLFTLPKPITVLTFSPDGKRFIAGSESDGAAVYDIETGSLYFKLLDSRHSRCASYSPDGKSILYGASYRPALIGADGKPFTVDKAFIDMTFYNAAFTPSGKHILAKWYNGTPILFDSNGKSESTLTPVTLAPTLRAIFSTNFTEIIAITSGSNVTWDLTTGGESSRTGSYFETRDPSMKVLAVSHKASQILFDYFSNYTGIVDLRTRTGLAPLTARDKNIEDVGYESEFHAGDFSADGSAIIAGSAKGNVYLFSTDDTKIFRDHKSFKPNDNQLRFVKFSPDASAILTYAGYKRFENQITDEAVRVWRSDNFESIANFVDFASPVTNVLFTPDGKKILTAHLDGSVILSDIASNETLFQIEANTDRITHLAISADGKRFASSAANGQCAIWNADTGRQISHFDLPRGLPGSITFNSRGDLLLAAGNDATLRLHDANTGNLLATLISFSDNTWAVVTPDNKYDSSNAGNNPNLFLLTGTTTSDLSPKSFRYKPKLLTEILSRQPPYGTQKPPF